MMRFLSDIYCGFHIETVACTLENPVGIGIACYLSIIIFRDKIGIE